MKTKFGLIMAVARSFPMSKLKSHPRTVGVLLTIIVLVAGTLSIAAFRPQNAQADAAFRVEGFGGYRLTEHPVSLHAALQSITTTPEGVKATVCMTMPNLRPWNPYASLTVNGDTIYNSEVRLLHAKDPTVMKSANRCYQFFFPLRQIPHGATATLRIEKLWVELGNGAWTPKVVATVKERAQKTVSGLDFQIDFASNGKGGGAAIHIFQKPQNMSNAEAIALINRLAIDELPVSWQTTTTLK